MPIVSLKLTSPSFKLGGTIPARYTCDGTNLSPGLHWGAIPKHTAELAVYIDAVESNGGKVQNSWAVLGLPPTLRGLAPGRLPAEAIVGRNSYGQTHYTLCPQKGSGLQRYVVAVYTLPHRIAAQPGFSAEAFFEKIINAAALSGLTGFAYERH